MRDHSIFGPIDRETSFSILVLGLVQHSPTQAIQEQPKLCLQMMLCQKLVIPKHTPLSRSNFPLVLRRFFVLLFLIFRIGCDVVVVVLVVVVGVLASFFRLGTLAFNGDGNGLDKRV